MLQFEFDMLFNIPELEEIAETYWIYHALQVHSFKLNLENKKTKIFYGWMDPIALLEDDVNGKPLSSLKDSQIRYGSEYSVADGQYVGKLSFVFEREYPTFELFQDRCGKFTKYDLSLNEHIYIPECHLPDDIYGPCDLGSIVNSFTVFRDET